jgi:hypothetical protein
MSCGSRPPSRGVCTVAQSSELGAS